MADESSARSYRGGRRVSRDFLRTVQQTKLQGNPPTVSCEVNPRIPSTHFLSEMKGINLPFIPFKEASERDSSSAHRYETPMNP
ncbi:unnamed protein product [Protopolystoma xenopodis]|uniref:Uncharacterized protein n=1 Tax=Protopolystoma xenopodis TaxID=117903 RepID=A0A3S5BZM2_9PLAT|nr:unnamed protein product [Protopolystoma xenopodis]